MQESLYNRPHPFLHMMVIPASPHVLWTSFALFLLFFLSESYSLTNSPLQKWPAFVGHILIIKNAFNIVSFLSFCILLIQVLWCQEKEEREEKEEGRGGATADHSLPGQAAGLSLHPQPGEHRHCHLQQGPDLHTQVSNQNYSLLHFPYFVLSQFIVTVPRFLLFLYAMHLLYRPSPLFS